MSKERSTANEIFIRAMAQVLSNLITIIIVISSIFVMGIYGINYLKEEIILATVNQIAAEKAELVHTMTVKQDELVRSVEVKQEELIESMKNVGDYVSSTRASTVGYMRDKDKARAKLFAEGIAWKNSQYEKYKFGSENNLSVEEGKVSFRKRYVEWMKHMVEAKEGNASNQGNLGQDSNDTLELKWTFDFDNNKSDRGL